MTHILISALDVDEVGWTPVTPPQLAGDAPVLEVLQPAVPFGL